jgi:hypothetical protein
VSTPAIGYVSNRCRATARRAASDDRIRYALIGSVYRSDGISEVFPGRTLERSLVSSPFVIKIMREVS